MIVNMDGTHRDLDVSGRDLHVWCAESEVVMLLRLRTGEVALTFGERTMRYEDLTDTPLLRGARAKETDESFEVLR